MTITLLGPSQARIYFSKLEENGRKPLEEVG
jgi:hypothetical protein